MRTLEDIVRLCKAGVHLHVNDHRDIYMSLDSAIMAANSDGEEISEETAAKMRETGNFYRLQFYPDSPVGFYFVYGADLETVVTAALHILDANQ